MKERPQRTPRGGSGCLMEEWGSPRPAGGATEPGASLMTLCALPCAVEIEAELVIMRGGRVSSPPHWIAYGKGGH